MSGTALEPPRASPARWTAATLIGDGWHAVKADPTLILVALLAGLLGNAIDIAFSIAASVAGGRDRVLLDIAGTLLNLPLEAYITVGWVRYLLAALRGQRPALGLILSGGRTTAMLVMLFVGAIAKLVGLALLIAPGLMLICGWRAGRFCLVDRNRGPIEALADSWALTDGRKWEILLLVIFSILLVLGGLLLCVVGVIPAATIVSAATAALYLRLIGERPVLGAPAAGS